METSLELLAWRESLARTGPAPDGRELREWAELLAAVGAEGEAAMLADVAALHEGFSPQWRAARAGSGSRRHPAEVSTLGLAVDELRLFAEAFAPGPVATPGHGVPPDIAAVARRSRAALEGTVEDGAAELAALTAGLAAADRRVLALDFRAFARAPLATLVPAIATAALINWALSTRDLAATPLGSPLFLHRAAALDPAGLGPYLGNVPRLVRDADDLFGLARIAAEAGGPDWQGWTALLSRRCRGGLLNEVIDELGDMGARDALSAILDHRASRPAAVVEIDLITRVRDAALDNGDHALAARAQGIVARLRPESRLEAVILGTIEASGGAFSRAELIFRHQLSRFPDDSDIHARLMATEKERFEAFQLLRGYGSPVARQETRLRRRGIHPGYPRRSGERIKGVDLR